MSDMIADIFAKYDDPNMVVSYGPQATKFSDLHTDCSCLRCADYRAMLDMEPRPTDLEGLLP